MARNAASPAARLRSLAAALDRAKALRPRNQTLSFEPMMQLLDVSRGTLKIWCNEIEAITGTFERGGNGVEWEFKPLAFTKALIKHFEAVQRDQAEKAARLRKTVGGSLGSAPAEYSLADLKQLIDVSTRMQDLSERQRRHVEVEKVQAPLRRMFEEMRAAAPRAVQESDPNGRWAPETRAIVEEVTRRILLKQERAAKDYLGAIGGGAIQPGASG